MLLVIIVGLSVQVKLILGLLSKICMVTHIVCIQYALGYLGFVLYPDILMNFYIHCIYRSVSKVHDEWFADEEKVRRAVGLLERPVVEYPNAREVSSPYFM